MKRWGLRNIPMMLIRLYQVVVSPWLGECCRFYPSCSHYAFEAFNQHGCVRGGWLVLKRILKCHPFHPGGLDPVPSVISSMRKQRYMQGIDQ